MIDVTYVKDRIWIGSYPVKEQGEEYGRRFDSIFFCADEWRPPAHHFRPAHAYYVSLTEEDSARERLKIIDAATAVAGLSVFEDEKVLVTCRQGLNRSGVVVAGALMILGTLPPEDAVRVVRKKRKPPPADPHGKWRTWPRVRHAIALSDYERFLLDRSENGFYRSWERRIGDARHKWMMIRDAKGRVKVM